MSSVCGGSKFTWLGDGKVFMEKLQVFTSLMDFKTTFFHYVRKTLPQFLQTLSFDKIWLKNQNLPFSKHC